MDTRFKQNHGMHGTPTYVSWIEMRRRCSGKRKGKIGRNYAGVTYDERWNDFVNFFEDMGKRPIGMTLDRIDRSKPYGPNNCRWATSLAQNINRCTTIYIEYEGKRMRLIELAQKFNIPYVTLHARLYSHGMSMEKALNMPVRRRTVTWPTI